MVKKASEFLQDLKTGLGTVTISINVSQESADKLHWLAEDDRDVTAPSEKTIERMLQAFINSIQSQGALVDDTSKALEGVFQAVAYAYRDDVADRIKSGRKDVPLRPLTREYVKQKGHSRIGYAGGNLYRDIAKAKVTVKSKSKNTR